VEDCPEKFSCELLAGTCPDCQYVCVPAWVNLCRPCTDDANCLSGTASGIECIFLGASGSFCMTDCESGEDCPEGYTCASQGDGRDATLRCAPAQGECECQPQYALQEAATTCFVENAAGLCKGQRICTADGLTDCDAVTPLPEKCDGLDNDCDGAVDEEGSLCTGGQVCKCNQGTCGCVCPEGTAPCTGSCVDILSNPKHCGQCDKECFADHVETALCSQGECKVAKCQPGFENLDGGFGNGCECPVFPETCDGLDNDCDGMVDGITVDCTTPCESGVKVCVEGDWSSCSALAPKTCVLYATCKAESMCVEECPEEPTEACNGYDDNCNGKIDEVFSCIVGTVEKEACGYCGTRSRTCTASCEWSDWSDCQAEGVCFPGSEEFEACGLCGTKNRLCNPACQWNPWSLCTGEGVCSPGTQKSKACGNCGSQTATCTPLCQWEDWSTCTGQGICAAGQSQTQSCGTKCGTQTRTCSNACMWGSWGLCQAEGACKPGSLETQSCGNCGIQSRTCTDVCQWGTWGVCGNQGECTPGASEWCNGCTKKTCTLSCTWGPCDPWCSGKNTLQNCWCDGTCVAGGDCCANACSKCQIGCNSCEKAECGGTGGNCSCEPSCGTLGTCCQDAFSSCATKDTCGESCSGQQPAGFSCSCLPGCGTAGNPPCCKDKTTWCK